MASHDEDFGSDLTPIEADGVLSSSRSSPARKRRDWRSLYEQAHARAERECSRADVAEARAEELRWAEVAARSNAGSWKSRFKSCRRRLSEAEEEAKELRRTEKDALSSQAEVARLKQLLAAAGAGTGKGSAVLAQHKIAREPRARRDTPRDRSREARQLSKALETVQSQKDRIQALRHENSGLRKAVKEAETQESTIRGLSGMIERLRARLRDFQDQRDTIRVLSWQVDTQRLDLDGLRRSLKKSEDKKQSLSQALTDAQADHRKALRRSRRQKAAIKSLAGKNARLRKKVKTSQVRIEKLEAQYAKLRASAAVLRKALFGSRKRAAGETALGAQARPAAGAPGHGRTWRPALEEKKEERNPPRNARMCSGCGKPYVMNGERSSAVIEIEVKAHTRRIVRPRWRRSCGCSSSPLEVTAPPAPRLFSRTPYGTSVWACVLFERYACLRPLHRVSAWMSDQGLPVSAGTLADSVPRFLPLFEPFDEAIRAHQSKAAVRHGDETVLAHPVAERGGPHQPRLAVDLGEPRCGLLPHRPLAQRSGRHAVVRGRGAHPVPGLRPSLVLQDDGAPTRRRGHSLLVLGASAPRLHPRCGRSGSADPLVSGVDRTDRVGLQAERGEAGALRPRSRTPDCGVYRRAGRVGSQGRAPVRNRRAGTRRLAGGSARDQGVAFTAQPPRRTECLRRQASGSHGQ